jgi:hypothetical protein
VIRNCNNLTGYAQARLESSKSERSQHLSVLEGLWVTDCASLVEMLIVPTSLKNMYIYNCEKLESIFGKQQGASESVQGSSCSERIMPTAVSELSSSPMNHLCPHLKSLRLYGCDSLPAVLNLPPSLKTITISRCSSIQIMSCHLDGLRKPQATPSINVPEPSAAAATREYSLPPCLEYLRISYCAGMLGGILLLPTSCKELCIMNISCLTSLECLSGEPLSLVELWLQSCRNLASLPNEPQAYMSLQQLCIKDCPALKKLPRCLQQRLDGIKDKRLDAQYEGTHVFHSLFAMFHPQMQASIPCTTVARHLPLALSLCCLKTRISNQIAV